MSTKDVIEQEVRDILSLYDDSPANEAETCYRAILPLLESAGYKKSEIKPQGMDAAGKFPDYMILPDSQYTWYLEAKTWKQPLNDDNVGQALDYANHNGRRWVVLSNGQEWRLYDNRIQGTSERKLRARANLKDEASIIELLQALSCESVRTGGLERYASRHHLFQTLKNELQTAGSVLIKLIFKELHRREGLSDITQVDVADYFKPRKESLPAVPTPGEKPVNKGSDLQPQSEYTLTTVGILCTGNKAAAVLLPGTDDWITVNCWADLPKHVVEWTAGIGKLPSVPYKQGRGQTYFINTISERSNGEGMRQPKSFQHDSQTFYVETHASAEHNCHKLAQFCKVCGIKPDTIKVRIASKE